jgi:hypothetical protein
MRLQILKFSSNFAPSIHNSMIVNRNILQFAMGVVASLSGYFGTYKDEITQQGGVADIKNVLQAGMYAVLFTIGLSVLVAIVSLIVHRWRPQKINAAVRILFGGGSSAIAMTILDIIW